MAKKSARFSATKSAQIVIVLACLLALLVLTPKVLLPNKADLTLLTVGFDGDGTSIGGTAGVEVMIKPGSGNIFIAMYPFSKLDTQISTQFAKEIACSVSDVDCSRYDFYYTIRANSNVIGGPSAGAAIASLTLAVLEDVPVRDGVVMTGSINAGGLIGPVGGVKEKILAAEKAGFQTVLIPRWSDVTSIHKNNSLNNSNQTVLFNESKSLSELFPNVDVVEVGSIYDAFPYLTVNGDISIDVPPLQPSSEYTFLMNSVAERLCETADGLLSVLPIEDFQAENNTLLNQSENFLSLAKGAQENNASYSRASFCFSANLRLRQLQFENFSEEKLGEAIIEINESISKAFVELEQEPLETLNDVQTKAIVDERLREAKSYLDKNASSLSAQEVAYAMERYRSAVIWSNFFSLSGQEFIINEMHLQSACEEKIAEVDERLGYITVLFGSSDILDTSELESAQSLYDVGDYALCLFKASKAKAEVDVVISSLAIDEENLDSLLSERLSISQFILHREIAANRMPLMGYSYYVYANDLREYDPYLAALYSSYALELSDLSLYFPTEPTVSDRLFYLLYNPFFLGFLLGILTMVLVFLLRSADTVDVPKKKRR